MRVMKESEVADRRETKRHCSMVFDRGRASVSLRRGRGNADRRVQRNYRARSGPVSSKLIFAIPRRNDLAPANTDHLVVLRGVLGGS
jgi:hypothetical protein